MTITDTTPTATAPTTRKARKATLRRDDIHRPGMVNPSEYKHLISFSFPGVSGSPGYNMGMLTAIRTGEPQPEPIYGLGPSGTIVRTGNVIVTSPWGKLPFFDKTTGSESGCDICGAHYVHGDLFLHEPTGKCIMIGHICADKMSLESNRGDWTRNQKLMARLKKDAAYQARKAELAALRRSDALKLIEANPGLEEALKVDHYISRDLAAKLDQYGNLSPKQIELAFKLAKDVAEKVALEAVQQEIPEILPPAGRVKIVGTVISTKCQDNDDFGTVSYKMLVQVEENGGRFKLWGTVPAAIMPDGPLSSLKGSRVSFTATVTPKEKGFGFYSRPAGATVLPDVETVAVQQEANREMEARTAECARAEAETAMAWI